MVCQSWRCWYALPVHVCGCQRALMRVTSAQDLSGTRVDDRWPLAPGQAPHSRMKHLMLAHTDMTDVGVAALLGLLPALQRLSLHWCRGITDRTLMACRQAQELRELVVSRCHRVTDQGMHSLVSNAPPCLRAVDVQDTGCTRSWHAPAAGASAAMLAQ